MTNGRNLRCGKGKSDDSRDGEQFVALPLVLIHSAGWRLARPETHSFVIDMAAPMYSKGGLPNGALMANRERLAALGWHSVSGIARHIEDAISCGLLVRTRQGGKRMPSLYGVTWAELGRTIDRFTLDIDRSVWRTVHRGLYKRPTKAGPAPKAERSAAATTARKASALARKSTLTGPCDGHQHPAYGPSHGHQPASFGPPHGLVQPISARSDDRGTVTLLETPSAGVGCSAVGARRSALAVQAADTEVATAIDGQEAV